MSRALAPPSAPATGLKQLGHFALHYVEMCAAMCIGFAVGDALYFGLASLAGYATPFSELPVLSVALVTVFMTAPPGGLAYVFPDYGATRLVIDGAFSPTFHAWAELALALGWLAILGLAVSWVLRRLLRGAS